MQLGRYHLYQNFRLKTNPEKEPAVAYQPTSLPAYQPTSLPALCPEKRRGYARLVNDYAQRQP